VRENLANVGHYFLALTLQIVLAAQAGTRPLDVRDASFSGHWRTFDQQKFRPETTG
jgi:hypothetical protein